MKTIRLKAPAKINLTLEILDKRPDGFHNIQSIMQAISLFDYVTISLEKSSSKVIELAGTSDEIPYDERNIVYKATELFLNKIQFSNIKVKIFIEKNIPVCAGLAGGSTDASATLVGLNNLFNTPLTELEINELALQLGSDLNFCLAGGTALCTSRGEIVEKLPSLESDVSLIKPINLSISAKEAYQAYANLPVKPKNIYTDKLKNSILNSENRIEEFLFNGLELAVINKYNELQYIKTNIYRSMMSGSGPTFFLLKSKANLQIYKLNFLLIEGLKFVNHGVLNE